MFLTVILAYPVQAIRNDTARKLARCVAAALKHDVLI